MKLKKFLLVIWVVILTTGCEPKTEKTKIRAPKPNTSKAEEILNSIKAPKPGLECDLEVLESGKLSKVFFIDTSKANPEKLLTQRIYTVNRDGESVEAGIQIANRDIFWMISYESEEREVYSISAPTSQSQNILVAPSFKDYFNVSARIVFDSKVNEFDIKLVGYHMDDNTPVNSETIATAKINNCIDTKMIIPLGI